MTTESQQLLAEYAASGSEAAFRELVARYINLVYSAALRLSDGDTNWPRMSHKQFSSASRARALRSPAGSCSAAGSISTPIMSQPARSAVSGGVTSVNGRL